MILQNDKLLAYISRLLNTGEESKRLSYLELNKDLFLLNQDKAVHAVYIIKDGICRCSIKQTNQKSYLLEFLGRGEIIGEIEAILDSYSLAEVQTMSTVALFKLDKTYFQQLMRQDPEFNELVVASLAIRLINTALKAAFQQTNTTEVTLQRLLLLLKQEQIRLPKNDLANYLGITVRTLNRSLNRLNESI
ncbi:hypothetical protein GCM10027036_30750 [Flavihumibacter cheonanensis]|uniref:Crp/Fnr family transcriptional regulator n=1 Tax=Flavihumibacter cheonanensis TaxID=1442385 RepID=UPI001EF8C6C3|nr:Crp/Fnr family transcriptional regulator [Flavihumibacter cheonanensis]MCG7752901.1 Crp/Fnr family transcriptional regulator [Flavihumibacter cheonanensis]